VDMVPMCMGCYHMFDVVWGDASGECVLLDAGLGRRGLEVFVHVLDMWWVD
jgi:hypothetical protein